MQKKRPSSEEWPKRVGMAQCWYHEGEFTGGECNKLLKNLDMLAQFCPLHILPFVRVFRCLNHVQSFFGSTLSDSFENNISRFESSYHYLKISVTQKVHILFAHVSQVCKKYGSTRCHCFRNKPQNPCIPSLRCFGLNGRSIACQIQNFPKPFSIPLLILTVSIYNLWVTCFNPLWTTRKRYFFAFKTLCVTHYVQ